VASRSGVRAPEGHRGMIRNAQSGLSPGCGGGAKSKGALYRETLRTTGFYMGRIVIVTREFTPIPSPPLRCHRFRESSRNAFGEACGIYRSDGDQTNSQKGPPYRLPLVGPEVALAAPRIHYEVLSPTPFLCRAVQKCEGPRNAFVQAWRNLSVRCVITSDKPGAGVPLHGRVRARL
jgi:hypothetical protein